MDIRHIELFDVDYKTGIVKLNKPEALTFEPFRKLIERDDHAKTVAIHNRLSTKIILFVYLIADPRSILFSLGAKDKVERARGMAKLPKTFPFDGVVKEIAETYIKTLKLSPLAKSYMTASRAMVTMTNDIEAQQEVISIISTKINQKMVELTKAKEDETSDLVMAEVLGLQDRMMGINKKIGDLIKELSVYNNKVEELRQVWAKEIADQKLASGGRVINNREH